MKIRLLRLSNDRHRLTIERADGRAESRELETRSVLLHDLVHYAVEAEAHLEEGFWGLVASGRSLASLDPKSGIAPTGDIVLAESLVGPMQSVFHDRLPVENYVTLASRRASFVDRCFVDAVLTRVRSLWGHWKGTPFHDTMLLHWPPDSWGAR